jgi:hypothetical protein
MWVFFLCNGKLPYVVATVPPFGYEDNTELQSIFELESLKEAKLLNTQCLYFTLFLRVQALQTFDRSNATANW